MVIAGIYILRLICIISPDLGASEPSQYGHVRSAADGRAAGGRSAPGHDAPGPGSAADAPGPSWPTHAPFPKPELAVLGDAVSTVSLDAKSVW